MTDEEGFLTKHLMVEASRHRHGCFLLTFRALCSSDLLPSILVISHKCFFQIKQSALSPFDCSGKIIKLFIILNFFNDKILVAFMCVEPVSLFS